jgi:carboxylate-amine ligase
MTNHGHRSFPFGIEEEYFLVNSRTRALIDEPPRQLLDECKAVLGDGVSAEYQRCQIEVATGICSNLLDARAELAQSRNVIASNARRYGLAPIAASTHPFTHWSTQHHTKNKRYNEVARDLQVLGRRMVIGGMHVHVGIDDNDFA